LALNRYGLGLHPRHWRIPPIDTYPRVVQFATTPQGRLTLLGIFALFMRFLGGNLWLWVTGAAAVVSFSSGKYRPVVALLCTGLILIRAPAWFEYRAVYLVSEQEKLLGTVPLGDLLVETLLACAPLAVGLVWLVRHFRNHPWVARPVLVQHIFFIALMLLVSSNLLQGLAKVYVWSAFTVFLAYFWFLAYALIEQRQKNPPSLMLQLATFHPFFGSTTSPWGKGAAYWRSVDSETPEELAVTQLKAIKLIVWTLCLHVMLKVFRRVVYGELQIPPLLLSFDGYVRNGVGPGPMGAFSIVANYLERLLALAAWGNVLIATARLAGFRLLRNTFRPLSARSIAEFWNRYDYYFKELLVSVYFYPTYLRCFKRHPRLRIAFATFMAAGVGNLLFHFMQENYRIPRDGLLEAVVHMQTYAFYCALLVTGIVISQLRNRRPPADANWFHGQFLPSLKVATFFCLVSFFDGADTSVELGKHFGFLFNILGIQ
jgi:hypothetical protein